MLIPDGQYSITEVQQHPQEACWRINGPGGFQAIVWRRGSSAGVLRWFLEELFEGYAELHPPATRTYSVRCV